MGNNHLNVSHWYLTTTNSEKNHSMFFFFITDSTEGTMYLEPVAIEILSSFSIFIY
jgi:hypothetical protein